MEIEVTGWLSIVLVLSLTSFGVYWCLTIVSILIFTLAGLISMLHLSFSENEFNVTKEDLLDNPLEQTPFTTSLTKVMYVFNEKKMKKNTDKRITGSEMVDSHLHEIFGLIVNDYITPWYSVITRDTEFVDVLRDTVQSLSLNISNRVKNVDWLYYLAGRLVEDLAGHLRLFRSAGGGEKSTARFVSGPARCGSPARSPARNSNQQHRRNKSDTDVAMFGGVRDGQRNMGNSRTYLDKNKSSNMTFEQKFFELEREIEKNLMSREKICSDEDIESCFIGEIIQILIYITLGTNNLRSRATFAFLRAISCSTLQSTLRFATDPDTLNTLVLRWGCRDGLSSESFLSVLRTTDNVNELKATLDLVQKEIQNLVSKDTGGECDITVRQQLSSLQYLIKIMNGRCLALTPAISAAPKSKPSVMTQLPLGFLLDNHLALCYFLDYAQSVGAHTYIFCLLSIQAWRVSTAKCIAAQKGSNGSKSEIESILMPVKIGAKSIHEQYLSGGSSSRLDIPPAVVRSFLAYLNTPIESRTTNWFDDIEDCVLTKLKAVETDFHSSAQYSRLLAELDMIEGMNLSENTKFADDKRSDSTGMISFGSKTSLNSLSDGRLSDNSDNTAPNSRSQSPGFKTSHDLGVECVEEANTPSLAQESQENVLLWVPMQESCHLETVIVETGLVQDRGRTYGVYAVEVRRRCEKSGRQQHWHIYRRYSDFHDLYVAVKEAYPELSKLDFPSKKTFHNTSRILLERRMAALGSWLGVLATLGCPDGPPRYSVLHSSLLLPFLSPKGPHDRQQPQKAINTILVQPLRQGMRSLRSVPGQLVHTVDDFMEGVSKVLNGGKSESMGILQSPLPTAGIGVHDIEPSNYGAEELPLRVLLILLDEVFELRSRNRWLRRQIAALLRQVITAMFADVLNKRILGYISSITSPETVVYCLDNFKREYFTKEYDNRIPEPRDLLVKSRTRVAVKTVLLSARQEELKHIMGSETTHRGLITIFELFQNQILNKRLMSVLLQGLLVTLYPEQDMSGVFQRLVKIKSGRSPFVFKNM